MPILHISKRYLAHQREWVVCDEIGIGFWVPKEWRALPADKDGIRQIASPDHGMVFLVTVMENNQIEVLLKEVSNMLMTSVEGLQYTGSNQGVVNGLETYSIRGSATTGDVPVEFYLQFIRHAGQVLMMLCLANEQAHIAHRSILQRVFSSAKAI